MAKRRIYTAPGTQVAKIATGEAYLEKLSGEVDSYVLHVNGVPSSSISLGDPTRLDFEYLEWMSRIVSTALPPGGIRAVHIGGAGCALARALNHLRPGSRQTAIDIDGPLLDLARTWFDLPRSPALALRVGDGAAEIDSFHNDSLDLLVRDAFDHAEVPSALLTAAFYASSARALKDSGIYLANVPDAGDHRILAAELNAMSHEFAHLAVASEPGIFKGRRKGNVVVIASHAPLPMSDLDRTLRTAPTMATLLDFEAASGRLGL